MPAQALYRSDPTVTVGKCGDRPLQQITASQAKTIQVEANLSDNQVGKVLKNLRLQFGRGVVEAGLRETQIDEKSRFSKFFSADNMGFKDSEGNTIVRPFVYCSDIVGFVSELANLRGLGFENMGLKIGIDGGKGFLKTVLTMYEPGNILNNNEPSRVTQKSGIGSGRDYSMLGRKKIMILAISPNTPENYHNLQIYYDMVKVNQLAYKQTGDLKALNILLGLMSCASLCGCCYCEAKRSSSDWWEGGAKLRCAANLDENLDQFKKQGCRDRSRAKDISANVVEKALLFDEDDDPLSPILLKCPPPALHLKLGLNSLLMELYKVWPPILDWLASKHIVLEPYHGGQTLEGNECNKVLKNLDSLADVIPPHLSVFLDALKCFRDVVESCFGFVLDPNFKQALERFRAQMKFLKDQFKVFMTNKMHIICIHVEEFWTDTG